MVAKVFHENYVLGVGNGLGNVGSCLVQSGQGTKLVIDPHAELHLLTETALLLHGAAYLSVCDDAPLLIDGIVFEAAMVTRTIYLRGQQLCAG